MDILLLILGLALVLVGANFLTDGAAAVAHRYGVPEFIIGLTIVAIGTSMPEMVVSTLSALQGNSDMAIGNVVGSNIFNTFVILGICALIRPVNLTHSNLRHDIPFGIVAAALLYYCYNYRLFGFGTVNSINRGEGILFLVLYLVLTLRAIRTAKQPQGDATEAGAKPGLPVWQAAVMFVAGLAGLVFGGELFLKHAVRIAQQCGVSESVIAITLVAGGTSLPELAASVVALAKGKSAMALGNVIGSNIANILLILGVGATITPLSASGITMLDLGMVLLGSVLLFTMAFTFEHNRIDRYEGILLVALYGGYIYLLLNR